MTPPETQVVAGHVIRIDRDKRRVWAAMPFPASMLGRLMCLAHEVCGPGAVWAADVGARLGAIAICARGGGDAWRADLDALAGGGAQ